MKIVNWQDYCCPKHGKNGNPECSICWENLERLIKDMNGYQTGENPINRAGEMLNG